MLLLHIIIAAAAPTVRKNEAAQPPTIVFSTLNCVAVAGRIQDKIDSVGKWIQPENTSPLPSRTDEVQAVALKGKKDGFLPRARGTAGA
jgi:hypothetical protein